MGPQGAQGPEGPAGPPAAGAPADFLSIGISNFSGDDPRPTNPNLDPRIIFFDMVIRAMPPLGPGLLPAMVWSNSFGSVVINHPGVYVFNMQGVGGDEVGSTGGRRFCQIRLARGGSTPTLIETVEGAITLEEPTYFSGSFTMSVSASQVPMHVQFRNGSHPNDLSKCSFSHARATIWRFN